MLDVRSIVCNWRCFGQEPRATELGSTRLYSERNINLRIPLRPEVHDRELEGDWPGIDKQGIDREMAWNGPGFYLEFAEDWTRIDSELIRRLTVSNATLLQVLAR